MTRGFTFTALMGATLAIVACNKTPEPSGSSKPNTTPSSSKPAKPEVAPRTLALGITWEDPPNWTRDTKPRPMRKATYKIPRAASDSEDGELAVFYFGAGRGGSIEDNVERWVGQFDKRKPEQPRRSDRTANGLKQHIVEIEEGTYDPGMMGRGQKPKPGYGMLGAIVEAPSGSHFFKLTGPKATVQAAKSQFYALLDSVKPG